MINANNFSNFLSTFKALNKFNVEYILIGGFAIVLQGFERFTSDIDIFIQNSPDNIERAKKALYSVFNDDSINEIAADDFSKYPVIRYGTPQGFYIDLIVQIGEMVYFEDLAYETKIISDISLRVATPQTLLNLKKDTMRDKDKTDTIFLKKLLLEIQSKDQ